MPLEILEVHFDCAGSQNLGGLAAGACRNCALVVVPCAFSVHGGHFSWQAQVARETSCFGGPKPSFRDRCKGSERLALRKADFVAGAVLWTWW